MAGSVVATSSARKGQGIVKITSTLTCAGGALSATIIGKAYGRIVGVAFDPTRGAGATITSTAVLTVTDGDTGATLFTVGATVGSSALYFRPTAVITSNTGAAVTAAATAVDVNRDIFVAGNIKATIASATTTDSCGLDIIVEEAV